MRSLVQNIFAKPHQRPWSRCGGQWLAWALLALSLFSGQVAAAARAFLDRDSIALGETVTLNIEVDGIGSGEPDLSALANNFRVLGSSSNTQVSLVNGQQSARTLWGVILEPLQEGVLGIPALSVRGQSTQALTLTVRTVAAGTSAQGDVFIEVESTSASPYVQQQLIYSIRLFYAVTLLDGQLDEPRAENAEIRRIGSDATYQSERNGRRYNVIERRYAITPQRSGAMTLPAPRFRGRALSDAARGRMFDPGRTISAQGEALQLDVRPAPATAASPWLPSQSLQYTAQVSSASSPAKVGEPITVTLRVQAQGLAAEQLPELILPDIEGAEIYPDQESSQNSENAAWVVGERIRRFAIVPKQPGALQIPALQMAWWDVVADRAAKAEIAAQTLSIVGVDGQVARPSTVSTAQNGQQSDGDSGVELTASTSASPWLWVSSVLAVLWLSTLGWVWRLQRRSPVTSVSPPQREHPVASTILGPALQQGDLSAIATALRQAAQQATGSRFASLQDVATRLTLAAQREAVLRLERHLYGAGTDDRAAAAVVLRDTLRTAFRQSPQWQSESSAAKATALPSLYPERDSPR